MAFVIVSTGALAGSSLRTVRPASLLAGAAAVAVAVLVAGLALGYEFGRRTAAVASVPGVALDPAQPEGRALIDRVGALSGRLIRLESEAARLAERMGLSLPPAESEADAAPMDTGLPSGGPLLAPVGSSYAPPAAGDDVFAVLAMLDRGLERMESAVAAVADASTTRDLDRMAYPSRRPIPGARITSGFGNRRDPFTGRLARHTGIDMPAAVGTPILASAGGRVRFAGIRGAYGRTVEIDHGNGLVTRYGHTSRLYVRPGEVVLPGQRIAAVGSSGRSTGPHLHYEVLRAGTPVEPRLYLSRSGT